MWPVAYLGGLRIQILTHLHCRLTNVSVIFQTHIIASNDTIVYEHHNAITDRPCCSPQSTNEDSLTLFAIAHNAYIPELQLGIWSGPANLVSRQQAVEFDDEC